MYQCDTNISQEILETDENFVSLSSGIKRSTKLKLGIHVDNMLMACVYENQAAVAYSSL